MVEVNIYTVERDVQDVDVPQLNPDFVSGLMRKAYYPDLGELDLIFPREHDWQFDANAIPDGMEFCDINSYERISHVVVTLAE